MLKLQQLKKQIIKFLVKDTLIHPLQVLLQLIYIHLFGPIDFPYILFVCGIFFTILFRQNYFWYVGLMIQPGLGYLGILNLAAGVLSCNQRWKTLLFVYCVIDLVFLGYPNLSMFYNVLSIGGLLYQNYHSLPFRSINDNKLFFVCFSTLWVFEFASFVNLRLELQSDHKFYMIGILVPLALLAANSAINDKVARILNGELQQLENPWHIVHYVENIQTKMKNPLERIGIEKQHKMQCRDNSCFCRNEPERFDKLLVRGLYQKGFRKFENTEYDECLQEYYVMHLIQQKMFPLAVQVMLHKRAKKWSIYKRIKQKRVEYMLEQELAKIEQNYQVKTIFENPFSYEKNYEMLKRDLLNLLEIKIKYWLEINKANTKMILLKEYGEQFLKELNKMHSFYVDQICEVEKEIRTYSGSIIYNLFLLIATNYKELAETNMKQIKKTSDSSMSADAKKNYKYYTIKASLVKDKLGSIENVNNNFSKLINSAATKSDYLGRSMNFLLPEPYLEEHMRGMQELRSENHNKLLGVDLNPIFLMSASKNIVPCSIVIKYSVDIHNQLSVIGIIKQIKNDCQYLLLDAEGKFKYTTNSKIDLSLFYTETIQTLVQNFKDKWKSVGPERPSYFLVDPVKIQLKHNDSSYTCVISSPLSTSFRYPKGPPLHLSIHNETQTYFVQNDLIDEGDLGCLKKINNIIDQAETESQASNMSRRNEIINIIQHFENNSSFFLFNTFYAVVALIFLLALAFISIQFFCVKVTWAQSESDRGNHYHLINTVYDFQMQLSRAISKGLSLWAINKQLISNSDFSTMYGADDYQKMALPQIGSLCTQMKDLISNKLIVQDAGTGPAYDDVMAEKLLAVTSRSSQMATVNSLIRKAISDCFQMSYGQSIEDLVSGSIYWQTLFPQTFKIIEVIKSSNAESMAGYERLNYTLMFVFLFLLVLTIIPIYIGNQKIQKQEDYIFQLMVSIEPDLLQKEISELVDLEMNLRSNPATTFNFEEKESYMPGKQQDEEAKSENKSLLEHSVRRKRGGELDPTGYRKPRILFYCCVMFFTLYLLSLFLCRQQQLATLNDKLAKNSIAKEWRNERMHLLMNLKKLIFNYRPDELIQGKSTQDWLSDVITRRKANYQGDYTPDPINIDCSQNALICKNNSLSSELSINVFSETLMSENFVDRTVAKIPFQQQIEQSSYFIQKMNAPKVQNDWITTLSNFGFIAGVVYGLAGVTFVTFGLGGILYLKKLKAQYINLTRMITFLSQEMIKKNKRVESFLQRLSKNQ